MLRFLRSHYDLIYKLSISSIFTTIDKQQHFNITCDNRSANTILRRSIQGIVLELIALELSVLIKGGHVEQPKRFIVALLSVNTNSGRNLENTFDDMDTTQTYSKDGNFIK